MESGLVLILCLKVFFTFLATTIFYLIWKYINQKALGMQTLLDLMVKDYIKLLTMMSLINFLALIKIDEIFPQIDNIFKHYWSLGIFFINLVAFMSNIFQMCASMIIRYLTIFHQSKLNEIEDKTILNRTRLSVGILSFAAAIVNGFNPKRPPPIYSYLMGKYSEDLLIDKFYVPKTMMVLAFLVMIFVQIKIERYDKKLTSNLAKEDNDQTSEEIGTFNFNIRTIRNVIFCFCLILFLYFLLYLNLNSKPISQQAIIKLALINLVMQIILTIIIPLFLIYRTQNLFNYFVNSLPTVFKIFAHQN